MFKTEYKFSLPKGYIDENGNLHKDGTIRLATAADEILPLKDPRVQSNPSYLPIILLARVITKLGSLEDINPRIIESLFVEDLTYIQELYKRVNGEGNIVLKTKCPSCKEDVEVGFMPMEG